MFVDEARNATDVDKQVTVLDAIMWLANAWTSVTPDTIQKRFTKCGFRTPDAVSVTEAGDILDDEHLVPLLSVGQTRG